MIDNVRLTPVNRTFAITLVLGWNESIAGCGARAVRTRDAVGPPETLETLGTLVIAHDTGNSNPALALFRDLVDLTGSVSGYPNYVDSRLLRHIVDHSHRPADAELLGSSRRPGWQTDWS
ncbi:hypothetical protein FHU38_004374 [Saccharomonospora amisosensis]|uniref:Uncharacterized protein n=1 Tax=Saccharomonospora amisosensis TaxID=1128677 RepID=A0A7X5UTS6_9PSEU|nr:hypothetical protein [Saccharomonospora amisosensis]NIJ14030.1 hypothetical protein [Saccharomonospora amisosensis]